MANNKDASFVDTVVSVRRVTKVTKGGKRFSFSAYVVSGDKKGNVGIGMGRSREVSQAITKATNKAHKSMVAISVRGRTLPYDVIGTHGASKVILRAASAGTGVIAGAAVRAVMEALGVEDVLSKSLGSPNSQNVVKATLNALAQLRSATHLAKLRGTTVKEMVGVKDVSAQ